MDQMAFLAGIAAAQNFESRPRSRYSIAAVLCLLVLEKRGSCTREGVALDHHL